MELNITFDSDEAVQDAETMKEFLETRQVDGVSEVELARTEHKEGEQGLGQILGKLVLSISGGDDVIKELIITIQKYIEKYWDVKKDKATVKIGDVSIPADKLSSEQIVQLVTQIKQQK
jgi:hypothetical protein